MENCDHPAYEMPDVEELHRQFESDSVLQSCTLVIEEAVNLHGGEIHTSVAAATAHLLMHIAREHKSPPIPQRPDPNLN